MTERDEAEPMSRVPFNAKLVPAAFGEACPELVEAPPAGNLEASDIVEANDTLRLLHPSK